MNSTFDRLFDANHNVGSLFAAALRQEYTDTTQKSLPHAELEHQQDLLVYNQMLLTTARNSLNGIITRSESDQPAYQSVKVAMKRANAGLTKAIRKGVTTDNDIEDQFMQLLIDNEQKNCKLRLT